MVYYYRTTEDGRIAFGKGGCSHAYLGRITQAFEDPGSRVARTEQSFRRIYPTLHDVPITHTWTGPIDRSETNSPFFGHLDRNPDILYGVGYSGTVSARRTSAGASSPPPRWSAATNGRRAPSTVDRDRSIPMTRFDTSVAISSVQPCSAKKRISTPGGHRRQSSSCWNRFVRSGLRHSERRPSNPSLNRALADPPPWRLAPVRRNRSGERGRSEAWRRTTYIWTRRRRRGMPTVTRGGRSSSASWGRASTTGIPENNAVPGWARSCRPDQPA